MRRLKVVALLLHDEWGALQRVLGLLTRKRVHVDAVLAMPQPSDRCVRVLLGSADLRFPQMLAALQRLEPVREAVLLEGWSDVQWAVPTGLAPTAAQAALQSKSPEPSPSGEPDATHPSSTEATRQAGQP